MEPEWGDVEDVARGTVLSRMGELVGAGVMDDSIGREDVER